MTVVIWRWPQHALRDESQEQSWTSNNSSVCHRTHRQQWPHELVKAWKSPRLWWWHNCTFAPPTVCLSRALPTQWLPRITPSSLTGGVYPWFVYGALGPVWNIMPEKTGGSNPFVSWPPHRRKEWARCSFKDTRAVTRRPPRRPYLLKFYHLPLVPQAGEQAFNARTLRNIPDPI